MSSPKQLPVENPDESSANTEKKGPVTPEN